MDRRRSENRETPGRGLAFGGRGGRISGRGITEAHGGSSSRLGGIWLRVLPEGQMSPWRETADRVVEEGSGGGRGRRSSTDEGGKSKVTYRGKRRYYARDQDQETCGCMNGFIAWIGG
jgi:hypothetical protein